MQLLILSLTKVTSQFGFATLAFRGCNENESNPDEVNRKYSQRFALQGASRDIFSTNKLEPRPGRVEVQVNIHEGAASKKRIKTLTPIVFSKCVVKFET